ncbi:MAG TPA: 50S ribosomal protein L23 [Porphyromonadaceae bacterium]|jgi:large subunit ribosomal protein L23|uniref:50S ribosomal protein L23 n=1 Tax=Limibacterium fermenti TaxID=3229863 RepID=UPI000E8D5DFE|nr:50S ribosomal protein L23 [Porphyromonadaceae bacterium]HBL33711.1 50S ribosomal protein L23 [Porphyromonadaceae bacterium]HBX18993.1 50S ribosomal protein L23 [Porphyromonadaceae bacterium]HBX46876.1 50S ribosomal protein L23 [Porphyromonadaceae bacterium]HCM20287.1 50S ribosomal protein L23 [Porphyromonadaceae bacterium]
MSVIIKPIFTEKQTLITDKFSNRYGFIVLPNANKVQIKNAVEKLYNVHVERVNTMKYDGKLRNRYTKSGVVEGRTPSYKKAIITLKEGDSIDLFSNI